MNGFLTTGQVAKRLRVSVSTLKRWIDEPEIEVSDQRNCNGWRLFSEADVEIIKEFKRKLKKNGKRFNETTLMPVKVTHDSASTLPQDQDAA